ncbi:MAG: hypothetical protein ACRDTM_07970, partial [Micromonosporaceae bacterium]
VRRRVRGVGRALAVVMLAALALPGCGADDPSACPPITPVASASLAPLPDELKLAKLGTVTGVHVDAEQITATLQRDATIDEAATAVQEHFGDIGWDVVSTDNEGFEAEVFVVRNADTGLIKIRESDCAGRVILDVTVVPAALAPSPSP